MDFSPFGLSGRQTKWEASKVGNIPLGLRRKVLGRFWALLLLAFQGGKQNSRKAKVGTSFGIAPKNIRVCNWPLREASKKKRVVGQSTSHAVPPPGCADGFVGPDPAEAAPRTPHRGGPECGVPPRMVRFKRGVGACATGPLVREHGLTG